MGDIIGPARIILEEDDVPVPRRGLDGTAHVKTPILRVLSGYFLSTSPIENAIASVEGPQVPLLGEGYRTKGILKTAEVCFKVTS